jgi:UDP-glucose 4-epimerase
MRVLVTGGSGFLGSHLADAASAHGHQVRVLDLRPSPWLQSGQEQVLADVRDRDAVREAATGCEIIFHLAAIADLRAANADHERALDVNVQGTASVIDAARTHGVSRLVHASSIYVHSAAGAAYRDSKRAAEELVREAREAGLATTVLRFGSLYGPRADAGNAVRRLLLQVLTERRLDFWGDGTEVREYIHVADAAELALDALDARFAGSVLHLTGRERVTTRELLDLIAEMVGGDVEVTLRDQPFEGRYRLTPYSLDEDTVELGRRLTGATYIDLGLGLLQTLQELRRELAAPASG